MPRNKLENPLDRIETISVRESDAVKALRQYFDNERYGGRDVLELRVSPPFETRMEASLHSYQEGNMYPRDMEVTLIHLKTIEYNSFGLFDYRDVREPPTRCEVIREIREHEGIEDPSEEKIIEVYEIYDDIWEEDMKRVMNDKVRFRHSDGAEVEIDRVSE